MKILSLNGGGSLGYCTAIFLRELEKYIGVPLIDYFDMFAGVSTGSLIAAALASGKTVNEICWMYENGIPKIFKSPKSLVMRIFKPKFKIDGLKQVVTDIFGDSLISEAKKRVLVSAVKITGGDIKPKFWKSWEDRELFRNVLLASCSAPTYFEPYNIHEDYYIDGGMATNNVSMCAVADAVKMGVSLNSIKVLNIACLSRWSYEFKNAKGLQGLKDWASAAPMVATTSSEPLAVYQCSQILGENKFKLIQSKIDLDIDSVDIDRLKERGFCLFPHLRETKLFLESI